VTLGIFSQKIMHVPYRLPQSFALMVVLAVLVFSEPVFQNLFEGDIMSKIVLLVSGLIVTALYLWRFTPVD
jgi:ABC-type cobalamin transport system permease subunit